MRTVISYLVQGLRAGQAIRVGKVSGTGVSFLRMGRPGGQTDFVGKNLMAERTNFKEVSKEKFKEIYFRLGGGNATGWTADYWQKFYEDDVKPGWKYMVQEPESPQHGRMMIVADNAAKEYRLFFLTVESEESLFDHPGKD